MAEIHDQFDTILILYFGSQYYSHLITRRCRELNVYAELIHCTSKLADLKFKPTGIILSGYPYSAYDDDAPHVYPGIYTLGVPILGMRYAFQEICWNHKGRVAKCDHREYGLAEVQISRSSESVSSVDALFEGLGDQMQVWMSHGDQLSVMPPDFHVIGRTNAAPYTAIAHNSKSLHGIRRIPRQESSSLEEFIGQEIVRIREICGPRGRVIGVVSGGVDSTVTAKLMREAIGDRRTPRSFHNLLLLARQIMVDNGMLCLNEAQQMRLDDVENPEQKRKIMGSAEKEENGAQAKGKIEWLLQGALYPDVIGSISFKGPSATTTTHHNVGGLLKDLFKDEVRALGRLLSIPAPLVQRHPFPGPGLAIRILGPVTREQVKILQQADRIYIEGIHKANLYNQISQATAILLPVKAIGVMGDKRTYKQVIALRAVTSEDFMTADRYAFPPKALRWISSRITNEVNGIDRVTYDISSKPPTVEWL
ncbi:hypothetical protein DFJ58DRAFT_868473 [Suillus subalutaceus]|uniref:uncharacterized protein n=1 Tax=Suillus subalutaceus TaxID=48586 RepID=UPI001B86B8D8|nr:uncharacterized protein DFJ58DRAFT_868473 [Suillus subalutaceus]KAG1834959.1 hypothetical protein DFJ58DRAFT_868473 [Suillus subalutaceus]